MRRRSVAVNILAGGALCWCAAVFGQALDIPDVPNAQGEAAFRQALRDMGTGLRLMCVAAHPDDEDGATLARYRMKYGARTFAVIATRGEGGQNETGPELYEELGVIRTKEMLKAAGVTRAELRFLNLPDFGYSKTAAETLEVWGHDEALRRLVRVIRETQPDVIITNHGTRDDHGHHQALGRLTREAFRAAGDADRFPELGLPAWQPARLYLREWGDPAGAVAVDIGAFDPLYGRTYAERAALALLEHESQGMGYFARRYLTGDPTVYYRLEDEAPGAAPSGPLSAPGGALFEGMMDRAPVEGRQFANSRGTRSELLPLLLDAAQREDLPAAFREQASHAAAMAAEFRLVARSGDPVVTRGQKLNVALRLDDFGAQDVESVSLGLAPGTWATPPKRDVIVGMDDRRAVTTSLRFEAPQDQPYTAPHAAHLFDRGFMAPSFWVEARGETPEGTVTARHPVYVDVAPAVSLEFLNERTLVRKGVDTEAVFELAVTNRSQGPREATVVYTISPGFALESNRRRVSFDEEDERRVLTIRASVREGLDPRDFVLTALVEGIDEPAHATARLVELEVPEARVGVIQSYDDTLADTFEAMGVPHETLEEAELTPARLAEFTTVLVDIRAYLVREDLRAANDALLKYVENGGTAIVMYQKTYEWEPDFAPYPLHVSRNRVTREDAEVTPLQPEHPVFTTPNPIEPGDWSGWAQERGLYFPDRWDERYTPLLAMSDPGEYAPPGSLLVAPYGEGTYVYTALVWYRQLRELHPGALRVFANMLAL